MPDPYSSVTEQLEGVDAADGPEDVQGVTSMHVGLRLVSHVLCAPDLQA